MRVALLLISLGAAACATVPANTYGSKASAGHPPPLPAGAAAVPMWDHFCSRIFDWSTELIRVLDEASANGWEMVAAAGDSSPPILMCFKRPRPGAPPERPITRPPGTAPAAPPQS
jgi:hypothetical protein